jgi:hypothetical protein
MSIESWKNLVETSDLPVLTRGGPSSSSVLNKINERIQQDIININSKVQELDRSQRLLSVYLEQQAVGIQGLVNNLSTLIPGAPAGRGIADFFSTDYVDSSNTANIDQDFGQATLPILSIQEKLHSVDSQGNIWIPDDSRLRFLTQGSYTPGNIPSDDLFFSSVEDHYGIGSQSDTFFLGGYLDTESYVYLKAILPQALNIHRLANRITFHPIPAFSHSLVGAYYRKTDGSWNQMDFNYLPGYTTSTSPPQASFLGPTRLHFQPSEVTQVCIVMKVSGWWGIQQFGVQLVEYGTTANLVVDMASYNPSVINQVILGGKDSTILNSYSSNITGTKVSVALSQTESYSSPVVTYVDARWS